jgi:hypothetical protein
MTSHRDSVEPTANARPAGVSRGLRAPAKRQRRASAKQRLPAYFKWRDGRPRWEPGPGLRRKGWQGRDLKDARGEWLSYGLAIDAAAGINLEVAQQAAGRGPRRLRTPRKIERSCRHLYENWSATPEFKMLARKTQDDYEDKIRIFLATFGDEPCAALGRAALKGYWRKMYTERGHSMANGILAVARAMLSHAVDMEWIDANPAFKLKIKGVEPRVAFWSPAKAAHFVETADAAGALGQAVADAVVIALHSGQRQGDVLAMPPRIFEDGRVRLTQFKTGALVDAPMTPPLANRVAAIRARWKADNIVARDTLVTDPRTGKPFTVDAFRKAFRDVRDAAVTIATDKDLKAILDADRFQPGLADLRYQDLRDTAVTRLALAGCTLPQIAAITGHDIDHVAGVVKHYLALDAGLADEAIAKLTTWLAGQGIAV